jgi:hypothetical protein
VDPVRSSPGSVLFTTYNLLDRRASDHLPVTVEYDPAAITAP